MTRLLHFSEDSTITTFVPRPVAVPSKRPPGMDWLNGPLVWAIEESVDFMYLFPRDCPRILTWPIEGTTSLEDREAWLGDHRAAAYIHRDWLERVSTASVYRYDLPAETFEDLQDAGMWVSRTQVDPLQCDCLIDLPAELRQRDVDLLVVDSLLPLRALLDTTLHFSGIRLRNDPEWSGRQQDS